MGININRRDAFSERIYLQPLQRFLSSNHIIGEKYKQKY